MKPSSKPGEKKTQAVPAVTDGRMQMADLAQLIGVSASTVSRALSGSPLVNAKTRAHIVAMAAKHKYEIHAGAANLRKPDVKTIAVVVLGDEIQQKRQPISDPFVLGMVGSLADALTSRGYYMLLARHTAAQTDMLRSLVHSGRAAGLILLGQLPDNEALHALVQRGVPLVVWGGHTPTARHPVVGGDNLHGGYIATRHLLSVGCKRIGFLGDITQVEPAQRYAGYQRAHREAGIKVDPSLQASMLFSEPEVQDAVNRWASLTRPVDAIFAASDLSAIMLTRALMARGLRVPQDVKVLGYDDIALAQHVHPSLSSVRQPVEVAGPALVSLLFSVLDGQAPASVTLPAELVVRDSTRR